MGGAELQCTEAFFPLSLNSLFLSLSLSRSDPLRRRSENSQWKEKFLFKL
jgi:hypothetical protein